MSGYERLEQVVHSVIAKPVAWALYGLWLAATWVGREAMRFGRWARCRWIEYRQKRGTSRSSLA